MKISVEYYDEFFDQNTLEYFEGQQVTLAQLKEVTHIFVNGLHTGSFHNDTIKDIKFISL